MPNLTAKMIEALRPGERMVTVPDAATPGLELYVTKGGVKTFSVRYTLVDGTRRRMNLGRWPVMSLADARGAALATMSEVAKGADPSVARKGARAEARAREVRTVAELGDALIDASTAKGLRASTLTYWRWLLSKQIKPRLGDLRIEELTPRLLRSALREIGADSGPATANRTLTVVKRMYNFGVEEELVATNPLAGVAFLFRETSRDRVLSDSELKAVWAASELAKRPSRRGEVERDGLGVSAAMALAVQLCALTCQRGGEVIGIRWGEIDLPGRTWVLPAARAKNNREHVIPLGAAAVTVIEEAARLAQVRYGAPLRPVDALFPSPRTRAADAASPDLSGIAPTERLSLNRAMARLTEAAGVANATVHDLRRTGATLMASERIGVVGEIVSRLLNHAAASRGVTAIYNRYAYVAEKRRALESWEGLLLEIVRPTEGAVVPLRAPATARGSVRR